MPPPSDIVCLDADDMTCLMYGVGILYGRRQYGIVTAKLVATTASLLGKKDVTCNLLRLSSI